MISHALNLEWCFGFCLDIGVLNLTNEKRTLIAYVSGHSIILYDYTKKTQTLLKGHTNRIQSIQVSSDGKWLISGDQGSADTMVIVWDIETGTPAKTFFDPHDGQGVFAVSMSADSKYLATLGAGLPQTACVWEWAQPGNSPIRTCTGDEEQLHHCVRFNPADNYELMSNSSKKVLFYTWQSEMKKHVPIYDRDDIHKNPGVSLTISGFLPQKQRDPTETSIDASDAVMESLLGHALVATSDGEMVLFTNRSLANLSIPLPKGTQAAIKSLQIHENSITTMQITNDYLITAGQDGHIRVHDLKFRLVAWFENISCGSMISASFRLGLTPQTIGGKSDPTVQIPELVVATKSHQIYLIQQDAQRPKAVKTDLLVKNVFGNVLAMCHHPNEPILVIGGERGVLQVWNFATKTLVKERAFSEPKLIIESLAYSPDAKYIAIGFREGMVKLVSSDKLEELPCPSVIKSTSYQRDATATFYVNESPIRKLVFSFDGQQLVSGDETGKVALFRWITDRGVPEWMLVGSVRSHFNTVTGIIFGMLPQLTLFSISSDRFIVEYDLEKSDFTSGIQTKNRRRIEQLAIPTSCCWFPKNETEEDFLVYATTGRKMKLLTPSTLNTRQTIQSPMFPGVPQQLDLIVPKGSKNPSKDGYFVFQMPDRIIGIQKMPFDGNPHRSMALIAHPSEILSMITYKYEDKVLVFTSGRDDQALQCWSVHPEAIDAQVAIGGEGYKPFIELLPGGKDGEFYKQMESYFYYSQLRSQGEDNTNVRSFENEVKIDQVPALMRALGYYPSEMEIEALMYEIRYDNVLERGKPKDHISFEEFIKLFVNHRHVESFSENEIHAALLNLVGNQSDHDPDAKLSVQNILLALKQHGEVFSDKELDQAVGMLTDKHNNGDPLPKEMTTREFISRVLGMTDDNQASSAP